jgi:spore coat polysaccharide biosynthesis protein SpsF
MPSDSNRMHPALPTYGIRFIEGLQQMKTGVVVQMRLDSSRLPRKALLPLGQGTLASTVMRRLRNLVADDYVLACDEESAGTLADIASVCGFKVFPGSRNDVLDRYIKAAEHFGLDRIVRATGDNPLVSTELANQLIATIDAMESLGGKPVDYAGHVGMPIGMGVELVRLSSLRKAAAQSCDPYEHEHVCPHLYRNPDIFRLELLACPPGYGLPEARLTIDLAEDYRMMTTIFEALGPDPSDVAVMDHLRTIGMVALAGQGRGN